MKLMELLTTTAAAAHLGITPARVRQLVRAGRMPVAVATPYGALFDSAELDRFRAEREARKPERQSA